MDTHPYEVTMSPDEKKRGQVLRHYPEYEEHWNDDESALWNWIDAVARDNEVDHNDAKHAIADAGDPIFGGGGRSLSAWIWFLA
jgi:hypothetical protein